MTINQQALPPEVHAIVSHFTRLDYDDATTRTTCIYLETDVRQVVTDGIARLRKGETLHIKSEGYGEVNIWLESEPVVLIDGNYLWHPDSERTLHRERLFFQRTGGQRIDQTIRVYWAKVQEE